MKELFEVVFDKDGNIKSCGREACKKLILACEKIKPGVDFGNSENGFMNVENIKALYNESV